MTSWRKHGVKACAEKTPLGSSVGVKARPRCEGTAVKRKLLTTSDSQCTKNIPTYPDNLFSFSWILATSRLTFLAASRWRGCAQASLWSEVRVSSCHAAPNWTNWSPGLKATGAKKTTVYTVSKSSRIAHECVERELREVDWPSPQLDVAHVPRFFTTTRHPDASPRRKGCWWAAKPRNQTSSTK